MMCAWKELLSILPPRLRREVDSLGKESAQELRLRINAPPELVLGGKEIWLRENVTEEDLNFIINTASRYSPWAAATMGQGYLTAPGGHRIGLCGEAVCRNGCFNHGSTKFTLFINCYLMAEFCRNDSSFTSTWASTNDSNFLRYCFATLIIIIELIQCWVNSTVDNVVCQ